MWQPPAETINTRVTAYEVCALPEHYGAWHHFMLTVEYRGDDRWAVSRHGTCYDRNGNQEYESLPTSRSEAYLIRFRFPLDEALAIAARIAPTITINGHTVDEALANGPEWL